MKPLVILLLLSAPAFSQDLAGSFRGFAAFAERRGGDPTAVVAPQDAGAGAVTQDAERMAAPVSPSITIRVAPFYCAPCEQLRLHDWSGFDVDWQTGGAASYPEISWTDSRGVKRTLTGAYRPDQVLWSWRQTQGATADVSAAQSPTPYSKIAEALEVAGLEPGQTFADIGCGDGRALMIAVEQFHASHATGVELDVNQAALSRERLSAAGLSDRTEVIAGDATKIDLPSADVGYVYLYEDTLGLLRDKLTAKYGTVVSYLHDIPGLRMQKRGDFYVWKASDTAGHGAGSVSRHQQASSGGGSSSAPAVSATPQRTARKAIRNSWWFDHSGPYPSNQAIWNGRLYSGPVCNSHGCRMCNSIRNQLRR